MNSPLPRVFLVVDDSASFLKGIAGILENKALGFRHNRREDGDRHVILSRQDAIVHLTGDFAVAKTIIKSGCGLAGVFLDGDLNDGRSPPAGFQLFDMARLVESKPWIVSVSNAMALDRHMRAHGFTSDNRGGHVGKSASAVVAVIMGLLDSPLPCADARRPDGQAAPLQNKPQRILE